MQRPTIHPSTGTNSESEWYPQSPTNETHQTNYIFRFILGLWQRNSTLSHRSCLLELLSYWRRPTNHRTIFDWRSRIRGRLSTRHVHTPHPTHSPQAPTWRIRHAKIWHFALLQWVETKQVILSPISTNDANLSDTMTKALGWTKFHQNADVYIRDNYHTPMLVTLTLP